MLTFAIVVILFFVTIAIGGYIGYHWGSSDSVKVSAMSRAREMQKLRAQYEKSGTETYEHYLNHLRQLQDEAKKIQENVERVVKENGILRDKLLYGPVTKLPVFGDN